MKFRRPPALRAPLHLSVAALALVAVALVATGCSLSRPVPVKQTYLIEAAAPAAGRTRPETLRIGTFKVAAPYRSKEFVYRETDLRFETDYYTEFLVAPAAMIGEGTARALEAARVFARVVPPGAQPDGDLILDGFVGALYGDSREAGKPAAELAITFYLSRTDAATSVPFWTKEYRRRVPVAKAADGYAAALSAAFSEIVAELARDLAGVELPPR